MNKTQKIASLEARIYELEQENQALRKSIEQLFYQFNPPLTKQIKLPKGVSRHGRKFRAVYYDRTEKKLIHAGLHDSPEDAVEAIRVFEQAYSKAS